MLRLEDPMTPHIFRASALLDGVLVRGQQMTIAPGAVRAQLLAGCLPLFAQMRDLAQAHFAARAAFILAAVDEYEAAIRALAALGREARKDECDGTDTCPVCQTALLRIKKHRVAVCPQCDGPYMQAMEKLDSSEGFGTWAI